MFAVAFNMDGRPVEAPASSRGAKVETLGATRQAAFICSNVGSLVLDAEKSSIHVLGGRYWIVGRVRLDARRDLEARLAAVIGNEAKAVPDAVLCLYAYATWNDRFLEYLAGDFCFVIWDNERSRLICARDQLGTRTLFHARIGNSWFVSDSLDWIVNETSIGRELDDYWISDFLTLGFSREFERTVYRNVCRLAPAHVLTVNDSNVLIRRYWHLNIVEPIYLRDRSDYGERFRELLAQAIADRMSAGRVGISMSGGLDSTALAACAVDVAGGPSRIVAECIHYAELMTIGEERFANLAAQRLGIELRVRVFDDLVYDPQWRSRAIHSREPTVALLNAHHIRAINTDLANVAPVWLEGEGPDNALTLERNAYLSWLFRRRSWGPLGRALFYYVRVKGIAGWVQTLRRHTGKRGETQSPTRFPPWLKREFMDRVHLDERVRSLGDGGDMSHPWHPEAIASFTSPIWQSHFDNSDFEESLAPAVWRHPFLDLRILEFMLSVPPLPWGWKKQLIREAMGDLLPAAVLSRAKTPLPLLPHVAMIRRHGLPELSGSNLLESYVDERNLPTNQSPEVDWDQAQRVHALDHWLTLGRP